MPAAYPVANRYPYQQPLYSQYYQGRSTTGGQYPMAPNAPQSPETLLRQQGAQQVTGQYLGGGPRGYDRPPSSGRPSRRRL